MQKRFAVKTSAVFLKEMDGFPPDIASEIAKVLKILEVSPLPSGISLIRKLKGFIPPLYRLRARDYRALYRIAGDEVAALKVVDRKELDRELKGMLGGG